MKLLLISSSFKGGGIASYATELVSSYSLTFEISVIIGDDSLYPLDRYGAHVYHYDMGDTSEKNAVAVLELINEKIRPDIIVNSCAPLMSLIVPFLNNDIKIINVSHSLRYDEADYAGLNSEYADTIIALSDFNRKYLEKRFNCKNKVEVIYNFVSEVPNHSDLLVVKQHSNTPVIVFSGGGTAAKSPEIIYKIVKELLKSNLNFKFYWMGTTTPPFKKIQPFKEIADLLPNDPRLIFTGRLPREEAIKITNMANVFLTPSRREGCPMALLEAMRVGTIAITSDYDNGCKEIIHDGVNGFVIPHKNINGFVTLIEDIITNPHRYSAIYENSYKSFMSELSFNVWKHKMDLIIHGRKYQHKERYKDFDSQIFLSYRTRLNKMKKNNLRHLLLFEYLPSALPFLGFYIRSKIFKLDK